MHHVSRCQIGGEEEDHDDAENVGDILYVQSKVVSEERVHQCFNHGKPKIDDEKCNDKICNGLSSRVKADIIRNSEQCGTKNAHTPFIQTS